MVWFIAVLVFSVALSLGPTSGQAQDTPAKQPGEKTAQGEATLFPVPNFTGDLWSRSKLTGDWGGLRTTLGKNGVQLDIDNVHTFQNVASGGANSSGSYLGNAEIVLKLDSQKMGLWPGGFVLVRGEAPFGTGVNLASGALMPVNTRPILALPARDEMVLSHVILTQFLSEKFGVALGKLDTTVGDANEFAHGRGDEKFMNLAFSMNPIALRTVPYSPLGMALFYLPNKDLVTTFSVVDTEGTTTRTGFDTLFKDGTTIAAEGRLTVRPFGLTGHQLLSIAWSNKDFTSLSQDRRTLVGNVLFGVPLKKESGSWAVMYNFDQYFYQNKQDSTQGVGVFGRIGFSDGKANPIAQFYSFGIGGKGLIPSRDQDRYGFGYYYTKIANDLRNTIPARPRERVGLDHEQGVELFYNIAATPWLHVTPDLQFVDSARNKTPILNAGGKSIGTAVVAGLRIKVDY